ncbi:VTC domain-containing protein [Alteromonas gracilis]
MLDEISGALSAVSLPEVVASADLQTRVDRKYLLTRPEFAALGEHLGDFRALEIAGRRRFGYESVYFDTPDLDLYRAHRQGRRRRFKVRIRTYLDSGESMLEVKTKGRRGETVKARTVHDPLRRHRLDATALEFVAEVLGAAYGMEVPELTRAVTTRYDRTTLVDLVHGERLTCDTDLSCHRGDRVRRGPDRVLVESKTTGQGAVDRALTGLGVRPVSLSKYSVGVALTEPHLPANRWHRLLTQEFGHRRVAA